MTNRFETAQICKNGHIITDSVQSSPSNQNFCDNCGESLVTNCIHCDAPIKGKEWISDFFAGSRPISLPNANPFCYNCGKSYPWTEATVTAAKDLALVLEEYSEDERDMLTQSIDELIIESPKTKVEAVKFSRLMKKGGRSIAEGFGEILIDIISETAKKIIWPSS
ncbi:MAG: DUF2321 domain-containing protein [Bacteroidetes bacterium]|nr:DUF2321 domain-containing protein [Bacteroidota bacterium]